MLQSDVACRLTSPPPNRRLHHRNRKYHNTTEHTHTHICVNFSDLLLLLGCLAACPGGKLKAALLAEASVLAEVGVGVGEGAGQRERKCCYIRLMRAGSILLCLWLQQDSWWQGRDRRGQQILAAKPPPLPRPGLLSSALTTPTGPRVCDLLIGGGRSASLLSTDSLFFFFSKEAPFKQEQPRMDGVCFGIFVTFIFFQNTFQANI